MLKYQRNKLVNIHRPDDKTLSCHGILDDDIYSVELDVTFSLADLEILTIVGRWNRWTTPECQRSTQFLQAAVGMKVGDAGFGQKIHKVVGRQACRHYANLLLEICHAAEQTARLAQWEEARQADPGLSFTDFVNGLGPRQTSPQTSTDAEPARTEAPQPAVTVEEAPAPKQVQPQGQGFIIDLHTHTSPASPCSSIQVDELIREAMGIGLSGICLTDHNHVWDPQQVEELRQKHGFPIFRGNEITTEQGDMVVFGLEKDIQGIIKLDELRKLVDQEGGFIIAAHPFRGFLVVGIGQTGLTKEQAMARALFSKVDAVEILNGKVTEQENDFASQVAAGLNLPVTGGSDAHGNGEVGCYATSFPRPINNEKELVEALKAGNYAPLVYRTPGA